MITFKKIFQETVTIKSSLRFLLSATPSKPHFETKYVELKQSYSVESLSHNQS